VFDLAGLIDNQLFNVTNFFIGIVVNIDANELGRSPLAILVHHRGSGPVSRGRCCGLRRRLLWTPAYWSWVEGRYVFYPGYWAREVGFYGGIDYGYGYTGEGYLGGRWENGAFFYNRAVNNLENVRITKVYNQTVVMNNRSSNVSFNGGKGGIAARPTSQQVAFAKERHVEATPVQRQHIEKASKDRALFSKQNHGEPAVAATPRAGVFQGSDVSRGSHTPVATKSNNNAPSTGAEKSGPAGSKETPKAGEQRRPSQEQPKAEEHRRPMVRKARGWMIEPVAETINLRICV
jgi:hypothetical protein